jgi:hypothetical protein
MLYRVAMETGLRRKELRTLTPSSLGFGGEPATVCVETVEVNSGWPGIRTSI